MIRKLVYDIMGAINKKSEMEGTALPRSLLPTGLSKDQLGLKVMNERNEFSRIYDMGYVEEFDYVLTRNRSVRSFFMTSY